MQHYAIDDFYFFGVLSMLLRSGAEIIRLELLFKTPLWATMLVLLLFSEYAASKGISNIGRILEFFGYILLLTIILISLQMFSSGDILNVLPLFDLKEINAYIKALPLAIMPFLGIEALTIIPLSKVNGKKAIWYSMSSVMAVNVFYLLIVYHTYMLLGVEDSKNYKDAMFVATRLLDIEILQFLKRFDIIIFIVWIFVMFCTFTIVIYTLSEYTHKIFSKATSYKVLIIVSALAYVAALLPASYDEATQIFTYLSMYFGLIPAFLIPMILLIMAKVKKHVANKA
ncbi:MAG: GerAB/ArcD/ProY family transporter [Clostridiales bacterium]|nr:GerAB/ArcD/ProY family transporter [Clostridiales bacterium]